MHDENHEKGRKGALLLTFLLAGSLLFSGCKKEETVEDTQQPELGGEESVDMQYVDEEDTQSPFYFSLEQQTLLYRKYRQAFQILQSAMRMKVRVTL